jgi:uncharacterized membrane protein
VDRDRIEIFSDAVFAVAITLLILDLRVPDTSGSVINGLADRWPTFAAFGISFVIVGCIWISHYRVFRNVREVDTVLLFLNLALLMTVVLVPFGTSLMAAFVTHADMQSHVAAALFSSILLLMGLSFAAVYMRIAQQQATGTEPATQPRSFVATLRFAVGLVVYALCVGLSFVNAVVVMVLIAAVAVYYIVDALASPPQVR